MSEASLSLLIVCMSGVCACQHLWNPSAVLPSSKCGTFWKPVCVHMMSNCLLKGLKRLSQIWSLFCFHAGSKTATLLSSIVQRNYNEIIFIVAGVQFKVGTGGCWEGAGLLLWKAAGGGSVVPGARRGERHVCWSATGGPLLLVRPGQLLTTDYSEPECGLRLHICLPFVLLSRYIAQPGTIEVEAEALEFVWNACCRYGYILFTLVTHVQVQCTL